MDLYHYATKAKLKKFAKITGLAHLKSDIDKLDIDQFKKVPSRLSSSKNKVDKVGIDRLMSFFVDFSKLSYSVKRWLQWIG